MKERRSISWGIGCGACVLLLFVTVCVYLWIEDRQRETLQAEVSKTALIAGRLYWVNFSRDANPQKISDAAVKLADHGYPTHYLTLTEAELDHRTIEAIGRMTWLSSLNLARTNVTDADVREFAKLRELNSLVLTGTKITDAGLVHLRALKSLRNIGVADTAVTEKGLLELKKWLPKLEIDEELRSLRESRSILEKARNGAANSESAVKPTTSHGSKWRSKKSHRC